VARAPGVLQLVERSVGHLGNQPKQLGELALGNPWREASASGFRNHVPQLALAPQKPRNGGLANAEALRQLGVRAFVSLIRSDDPAPQVQR
jgi:hypothetical protein